VEDQNSELIGSVNRMLAAVLDDARVHPVLPSSAPEELAARLELGLGREGRSLSQVVDDLVTLAANTPRTSSRHFFNQLFGGRETAAVVAETLSAVLNNSMYTYKAAGCQILLERELLRHMAQLVKMPDAEGSLQAGGSLSNLLGLLLARNRAFPQWREKGPAGQRPVLYTSSESHYSVPKAAGILGIGRENVRRIVVDERGRMRPEELQRQILADERSGRTPFFVNATAGTTVRGAFDPLDELARITGPRGLWLHVDGAFGASVSLSPHRKRLLRGVENADSLAWDPHKMMGVPLPCSVLLTRERGLLRASLSEKADYLFQENDEAVNPGDRNLHCGRRNDALKLWAAWRYFGDSGWERRIERQFALASYAARRIREIEELRLVEEPPCITVCFEVLGKSSEQVCRLLAEQGLAKIGYGKVHGRKVIRLVTVNPGLREEDLETLLSQILAVAAGLG
jgi:glutamate/tyrosine decarboxylase-like PLP-dependent enzyme